MKNLRLVILLCGVVGLVALIVPFSNRSLLKDLFEIDQRTAIVYAAIFVLPVVMGALALARPPMQSWQSAVALASFVLGFSRLHVWDLVLHLGSAGLQSILLCAAIVIGALAAIAALMKPEAV